MQQIVQNIRHGKLSLVDVPDPIATPGQVVIANVASVVSAGTEKVLRELAQKSLLQKARSRPDHVRRVLEKLRQEGVFKTLESVRGKLADPMALGYSSSGVVLACGAGAQNFKPGDRVASNGPHAGVVSVARNLCAHVPQGVSHEQAAFAVIAAIALQGVRLGKVGLGDTAFVIGLGIVGQIAVSLLKAAGCRVISTDLDSARCDLALRMGADTARPKMSAQDVVDLTRGLGADAVFIAAATSSDGPVTVAGEAARKKGRVVVIGSVGMAVPREPYFKREIELVVSCSYGPGRYDPIYEEQGLDYPAPYVRWTEQRNIQAVLDFMAAGQLDVSPLVTHRFKIELARAAYELIENGAEPFLAIVLEYPEAEQERAVRRIELRAPAAATSGAVGVGVIGAGSFARGVLIPAIDKIRHKLQPRVLCSAKGLSAADQGERLGFETATTDEDAVYADPNVGALFIVTQHHLHARQVLKGIEAGKHVFVEKPLGLTIEEIVQIEQALLESNEATPIVMVGFNRRFSPAARELRQAFADVTAPLTVSVRFNAGAIAPDHWTQSDEVGGGRIVGEACHAIDLATFLTGSVPVRVFAESIGGAECPAVTDDQCFITLRHANGSISSIGYLAGGDRAFPKERVEVFGGGRVGLIDDFREVVTVTGGRTRRKKKMQQDKGHRAEIERFAEAVTAGGPAPIPWKEIRAVSLASILAVRSLREGMPLEIPGELPSCSES
jgi:predicted dehydrogenase/threonine dehydrogenase-like Zn-dependent dehydrogenase